MVKPVFKHNRWLVLVLSCWIQILNASCYVFSSYSQSMKTSMQLDQKSLTTIAVFLNVGSGILGVIPGWLYTLLPHWGLILSGVVMQSFGFFMTWLTISHRIEGWVWQLGIYHLLIGVSLSFLQTAVFVTNVRNFPAKSGAVIGLLKGYQVLGASIIVQLFYLLYGNDQIKLPWMLSWLLLFILLLMCSVRTLLTSRSWKVSETNFYIISGNLVVLAAYLLVVNILQMSFRFSQLAHGGVCLIILVFVLSMMVVPVLRAEVGNDELQLLVVQTSSSSSNNTATTDLSLVQVLRRLDFWLLFLALILGLGSSSAVSANLAQLANSLGYTQRMATICVSLFCICSCWGRIGVGLLSDHCKNSYNTPKTMFLMLAIILIAIATFVAAIPVGGALLLTTVLGGLSEGAQWCLCIAVASDLFGVRSLSIVYNILYATNPIGSYVLSTRTVGYLYDKEAGPGSLLCHGGRCFRGGFAVLTVASLIGASLVGIVVKRSKIKS